MANNLQVRVKEKCIHCGGDGIGPDRGRCTRCKGKGWRKSWMDAREFLYKYICHLKSE